MDKIILKTLVDKWQNSLRYLKGHQDDLSPEEWSAIEVLQDLWRNMSFGPDLTREANEMIDVLINSDKFHSNNRDIITNSKDFRAVAKKFYTESAENFNELRAAMGPARRPQTPRPVQPSVTPVNPDDQALNPGILMSYVRDWHRGMVYLMAHEDELDTSEINALALMRDNWKASTSPGYMAQINSAADALRAGTRLHNSNRDIITNSKYVTAAARKYNSNKKLHEGFAAALAGYLRQNPLPSPKPVSRQPIRITDIRIGEHDASGNWKPSSFYTDLTYLYVKVSYERLNPRANSADIAIKFLRPDGTLDANSSTPGFTLRDQNLTLYQSGNIEFTGWGNKNGFGFRVGTWTVEVYVDGEKLASTTFTMRARATTPPPPPPPPPPRPTGGSTGSTYGYTPPTGGSSSGGGRKSRAWMWIVGIIAIVGGYFGVNAYLEKRADDAASVMYAISDLYFYKEPGTSLMDHHLKESDRLLVYSTDDSGWAHVKSPSGKKGYVNASHLVSPADNELLTLVTGEKGNSSLDAPHKRAALLHLLRSDKIKEEFVRSWRLDDPGPEVMPNTVRYVRLNDGTDPDLKTLFMKLHNDETRENKIAIYAFPSDSASRPVLRYFADAPAGKEIAQVSYSPRNGYYSVNYGSADKHVSALSSPDSDNPVIITGLQFVNINNSRRLISNYVTQQAQYVAPKVTYQTTSGYKGRNIKLDVKLFDTYSGDMLRSSDSAGGDYTYSTTFNASSKGRGTETLDGWGNSKKNAWRGGVSRRYEIYHQGRLLASGIVAP